MKDCYQMKTQFIPIDYDYFDWQGKNYARIIGRDDKARRVCIIDSCPVYLWAILKNNLSEKKINALVQKIEKIKLDIKGRKTKVEKVEVHKKRFLEKDVLALKIFATNYKDLHDIADKLGMPEITHRRGYDIGYITHYITEKKLNPLCWYEIEGELLNNSQDFGGIDAALDVDICVKVDEIKEIKGEQISKNAGSFMFLRAGDQTPQRSADNVFSGGRGFRVAGGKKQQGSGREHNRVSVGKKQTDLRTAKTIEKEFKPKILAYDIETDELKIGKGEILMLSLVSDNFKKVITWKKSGQKKSYVEYVKDEAELLEKFTEHVRKISPDFLVGYFSDGFDLPYLKARAEKLKIKLSLGLDNSQPKFSRGNLLTGKISGIVHIDLLRFIRTAYAQYMQSETLSLNEVAKEFLGDKKKKFTPEHSSKIQDWKKYHEYNLHDSVLTYQLFEKFWPDLQEFAKVIREPVFDLSRFGLSKYIESYILHNLGKFNEIPEKRPTHNEITARRNSGGVKGAFVFEPKPGIYENIAIFDFTSMHTSIIISMNISKSTLLTKKEKGAHKIETERGKFYFSKKTGFFPAMLQEIFEKRKEQKQKYKANPNPITKARSNAFKLLSASAHGYIAFFGARYYSIESSASILSSVRKFNKEIIDKTKKNGYEVIFSDTDSVGFLMKDKSEEEIKRFLKKLNSELPGVMELELEGFFRRGIWVTTRAGTTGAKKKYALIDDKRKLKIRGFETVRRDWCALARKLQNKILKQILQDGNEKKALEYLKSVVEKIRKREIEKGELIIRSQLRKPLAEYKAITPHVIAAQKMKEQKIPVSQGGLIEYYITETREKKKLVRDKVKLPTEKGEYNIEYYLERQILPAVENIFQVFGVDIREIIDGKKQMTLGDFGR